MPFSKKTKTSKITIPPNFSDLTIPDQFKCPISLNLMKDPVTAPTGITYDRENIEKWIELGNSNCPVTNRDLNSHSLIPNHTIRRLIQNWCVSNHSHGVELIPTPQIPISQVEATQILSDFTVSTKQNRLKSAKKLRSLIKQSEKNRLCFLSVGAPIILASIFKISDVESAAEILFPLTALLPFEDQKTIHELSSSNSLNLILQIMKYKDINSKLNSVLIIKKIASTNEDFAKSILRTHNGVLEALVEIIKKPISTQATKISLAAIFYFISTDKTVTEKVVSLGLIQSVIEILFDSDKSAVEKALIVLDALCGCELGRKEACENALTVPLLAKKIFRVSESATEFAVSALWKVCRKCGGGECLMECLEFGVMQKMLLLLQIGCGETVKEKVTEMIKMMSFFSASFECVDTADFKGLNRIS